MDQKGQGNDRTDDLPWGTGRPRAQTCFYCMKPGPTGEARLGGPAGAVIDVCALGTGCQDGRRYHGLSAEPHWPDEYCEYCAKHGDLPAHRGSRNAARRASRTSNVSRQYR